MVTNVKWEAGADDYSYVTFDLSWGHSWRAKWVEPAATSVTGKDMEVESWDAAWVFVKFLPDRDSKQSVERNHWQHAALDPAPAHHVMPAGAMNTVRLFDGPSTGLGAGGNRGIGVSIYRDAVGYGPNNFKGIKLRWLHGPSTGLRIDPAKAAVRVYPIAMVYVPEGPFKVGTGAASGYARFPDGPTFPLARSDRIVVPHDEGSLTDGSWRGGPVVPFLVDAEWNGPAAAGSRARRIGVASGQLWSTLTYPEVGVGLNYLGSTGVLNDEYPTGYEAFYCMKYDVTQGQYVDFLNSLPPDVAAGRAFVADEIGCDYPLGKDVEFKVDLGPAYQPLLVREKAGLTINVSTLADDRRSRGLLNPRNLEEGGDADIQGSVSPSAGDNLLGELDRKEEEAKEKLKTKIPPLYSARLPFRSCSGINRADMYAYAVWAGLRPMTELEFEKACRGARNPVPFENNTGTTDGMAADVRKDLVDAGLPTERFSRGNSAGGYGSPLTVFRVGCFATPTSDRVSAGATYWGILELGGQMVSVLRRDFRGTHGDGTTSAGKPDGSWARHLAPFAGPEDWPKRMGGRGLGDRGWINSEYINGRFVWNRCRLVASAGNRLPKAASQSPSTQPAASMAANTGDRHADAIQIANVKWEAGNKDYSTISFDLAWDNSWRATWTEPADKNVTGQPLRLENWDAAWVFLKFRTDGTKAFSHATLSSAAADHQVPAGATLDVGLNDDSTKGVGVFIYRSAVGSGANDFKNIKLRWLHGADQADPGKAVLSAHAIGMVYVPAGTFQSRVPWEKSLTTISTGDATKEGGCRVATNKPVYAECPNGYTAFYSAKYAISQGQYADFLNSLAPGQARASYPNLYTINRFTIRCDTNTGVYAADVPGRGCNFLTWKQILGYEAWAGLRPITDLEYEKACRGPRVVARSEDAWAQDACAPATGLPAEALAEAGASFWGIRGLSLSGCVHEWPGIIFENNYGRGFKGTHGDGRPVAPPDWPVACSIGGNYGDPNSGDTATWVSPDDMDRSIAIGEGLIFDRTGRYGARAVRTAAK
jgi:formylglycine-generating enzyme required for sulfatase activity